MVDLRKVETVELDLSTLCNAKCRLCFRQSRLFPEEFKKPAVRKLSEIQDQLACFQNLQRVELIGQMSDPLCYPQLPELVSWMKSRGLLLTMYTNGSFSESWVRAVFHKLRPAEDRVQLTICGLDQKQHETYRAGTSLAKILATAKVLRLELGLRTDMAWLEFGYNAGAAASRRFTLLRHLFSSVRIVRNNVLQPISDFGIDEAGDVFSTPGFQTEVDQIERLAHACWDNQAPDCQIECAAAAEKRAFIDFRGEVFPCWWFFENCWQSAGEWSYGSIAAKKHRCCRYCQKPVKKLLADSGLCGA